MMAVAEPITIPRSVACSNTATAFNGECVSFAVETLPQAFASLPDPRRKQGTRYSVAAILTLAVVAVLANHTSVLAIAEWTTR
jgi:hypothetical protein